MTAPGIRRAFYTRDGAAAAGLDDGAALMLSTDGAGLTVVAPSDGGGVDVSRSQTKYAPESRAFSRGRHQHA